MRCEKASTPASAAFEEGGGAECQGLRAALEAGKGRKWILPKRSLWEEPALQYPDFSSGRPVLDFSL